MKKGLTLSLIFEAESANYGEGFGNISPLKKLSREGGDMYSYISRQALRYNMINQLNWDDTPVEASGSADKKVIQFSPKANIKDNPEIDLFGYMKTTSKDKEDKNSKGTSSTRNAVVRLSNAVALESYHSDSDYLTNMGLAKRIQENNSIAQSEIHKSFYSYTITIDLDRIGVDGETEIENSEKAERVSQFLETVEFLYRDIRGRRENLAPVFAIGGLYDRKNPFFENRLTLKNKALSIEKIQQSMQGIEEDTMVGYLEDTFSNNQAIKETLNSISIGELFDELRKRVGAVYNESN